MSLIQKIKIAAGPALACFILFFFDLTPGNPFVTKMAAVAVWMAVWWLTEAVHLTVTALLPIVLFPALGIMSGKEAASEYMDQIIFLFIGGFIISFAIKKWKLHDRIALKILSLSGTRPVNILMGVMITTFVLSMWISNTATVMMLIPAVLAIVHRMEEHYESKEKLKKFTTALLIGLAYSSSIGGMSTLVGTPTNMIFVKEYQEHYPNETPMNFTAWFMKAFPVAVVLLIACFLIIYLLYVRKGQKNTVPRMFMKQLYDKLGKPLYEEQLTAFIFVLTALLWFTRSSIEIPSMAGSGVFVIRGWSELFAVPSFFNDSTVAICMALLFFLIPSKKQKGEALLVWKDVKELPFDIIFLFGGGFALAKGFEVSGLSGWLAGHLTFISSLNFYVFILIMCLLITLISEFASNVASIQLMIPILVALQQQMQIHPLLLMVPATLAATLGFMLPVATAPNTIVFGTGMVRVRDFWLAGFLLDIAGVLAILLFSML